MLELFHKQGKRQDNDLWGLETGFESPSSVVRPFHVREKLASFVGTYIFDSVKDDAGKCIEMLWKYDAGKCIEL